MEMADLRAGQRIRVNMPGVGDHGQVGTIKKVRGDQCYVHLDWDDRPRHYVVFDPADLDHVPDAVTPPPGWTRAVPSAKPVPAPAAPLT